jgi:C-terminal processing protease CtpA/Prc
LIAGEYASLFSDGDAVAFAKNSIKAVLKLPMMMLVGGRTSGDGEIFASLLKKSGRSLVVGEKTAGMPFARIPVKLQSGGILLVPDIPPGLEWIKTAPIEPGIAANPYPQIEYSKISGEKSSETSDEAVRRVCDLLISIEALHKDKETGSKP